jgi:hypothetical protein
MTIAKTTLRKCSKLLPNIRKSSINIRDYDNKDSITNIDIKYVSKNALSMFILYYTSTGYEIIQ